MLPPYYLPLYNEDLRYALIHIVFVRPAIYSIRGLLDFIL